jgi:ERCC4-type nuclease
MKIIIDSREQNPLEFKLDSVVSSVEVRKLDFGDYGCEVGGELIPVVFERKSIPDLFGTLANKVRHLRFKEEILRAKLCGSEIILLIEGDMKDVLRGTKHSKFPGASMIKMLFTIWAKYKLIPVFGVDREQCSWYVRETFRARGSEFKRENKDGKENRPNK